MKSECAGMRVWSFLALSCLLLLAERVVGSEVASAVDEGRSRQLRIENADTSIAEAAISGQPFHAPNDFYAFEESRSPRIKRLREEYRLDEVVQGEESEFARMLKLRHWVHSRWPIDNKQQFSGGALEILEEAKTGAGFQCAHSMRVQHAVMTAMGFVTRDLGVDRDDKELGSGHHGVNEVWSNQYAKWVLMDAKYDIHFERDGLPLSAMELHEAIRANQATKITKVQGPPREVVPMKGLGYPESNVLSYWWVSYHVALDGFTGSTRDSRLVVLDNEPFRNTTWYRAGRDGLKKHWAYAAKSFIPTTDRHRIQWTPGVPELQVRQVSHGQLDVTFRSVTPNLKTYQVRLDQGPWKSIDGDQFRWVLGSGNNSIDVRTQNDFDSLGPTVTATLQFRPADDPWQRISPDFTPPQEFSNELGDYRSPLLFSDGRRVKTAED